MKQFFESIDITRL